MRPFPDHKRILPGEIPRAVICNARRLCLYLVWYILLVVTMCQGEHCQLPEIHVKAPLNFLFQIHFPDITIILINQCVFSTKLYNASICL